MTVRATTPSSQRLDSGYHSPSVTSSTLICSSAAARTSWTGDRMAVRVSMRASFSPCWTGPAAEPGRALPAALMLCSNSQLAIQTDQPAQLRREQAKKQTRRGKRANAWKRGGGVFREEVHSVVRFSPRVFVFKPVAPPRGAGNNDNTRYHRFLSNQKRNLNWEHEFCHTRYWSKYFKICFKILHT